MSEKVKKDKTLDCIGLYCPEPVFRIRLEMDNMSIGQVLEIVADDPAAEEDIKARAKATGQEIVHVSKEAGRVRFPIRKIK